ncbi:zinc-dependent metalloprotease [Leucobacter allii]|uniref:zinc-dependent metalloprotease n=1 Tax=Leucobacter allii TaxID=2932247 RepID=UPI001FD3C922|nr:zinc-dependent metalloprotease [Leucobacter allii]UOR00324.1 zinc-dependent metalloprotease [Leucobacter allii]
MSANGQDGAERPGGDDFEELQRILREMLSGSSAQSGGIDPEQLAKAAGIPFDGQAMQGLFSTMQHAMQHPSDTIDWSATRKTAIEVAADGTAHADPAPAMRAFPVAALWLDEATDLGPTPDAPRVLSRIEWVQQSVDTWVSLAEPVAESITAALMRALQTQMPEELSGALQGAAPMLRSVGGALFAVQLGSIVGKLSGEVVSAGDIGIPLLSGPSREGGALLPSGVAAFAEGLEQDAEAVTLYLAVRELAHARLFRHSKWLRLHLLTAITEYARGIRIDTDRIEELARDIDPAQPERIQELIAGGALIPPKTEAQEAAHARLETMLALIEGWVDVVTADAATRLPGAEAIAEMVRRRRATGGPAEHAFAALAGLELRPRRLRDAAALWRLVGERSDIATRDGLWAHPDLLPTAEELDHPARLLERLGLAGAAPDTEADEFEAALARLLDGALPPHAAPDPEDRGESGDTAPDDAAADDDEPGAPAR